MDTLFIIILACYVLVAPVVAMVLAINARRETALLRDELYVLRGKLEEIATSAPRPAQLPALIAAKIVSVPTPLPATTTLPPAWQDVPESEPATAETHTSRPPPIPAAPKKPFSLEQFMGAKLFAWLGGLAMFFGVVLFVKYAFENNLISPAARIGLGYAIGAALLGAGLFVHRLPRYRVLAQSFCATGVVILYGVTFAAHAVYHFAAFGTGTTFAIMAAITVGAFFLAVRLDALVVAVLGMLGGFLTPILLSTGLDQTLALFGYIALLDIGLLAICRVRPWRFLVPCAAAGTVIIQVGWFAKFFQSGGYDTGAKTLVPMGILLGFSALFLAAGWLGGKRPDKSTAAAVLAFAAVSFAFAFLMLGFGHVTDRPALLYGFLFLAQLPVLAIACPPPIRAAASLACSVHLAAWTASHISPENLTDTLTIYLAFGALFAIAGRWKSFMSTLAGLSTFALMAVATANLSDAGTTPIFPAALAMAALLTGLWLAGRSEALPLVALIGTLLVEAQWHALHFHPFQPAAALAWYIGIYLLFLALPFAFRRAAGSQTMPWTAAALSGVGHFLLVKDAVERAFPNDFMGLVPAAFAIPSLAALFGVLRIFPEMDGPQRSRVAWFGGVSLLFITLIFPIQFEREWITVSWAIEGSLLIWLFRRVPHPGLRLTGLALLTIAFVRLALNPAVLNAYPRGARPILNWHLYSYGLSAAACIAGAIWVGNPQGRLAKIQPRGMLYSFGGILLFLLLNIEIADYFTPAGSRFITLSFSGNFARDMSYGIAWGLFALALLGIGFITGARQARYAAVGLLAITLAKLFLHDLAAIESVWRIAAFVVVAAIAFAASFLYQRFYDKPDKPDIADVPQ